MYTLQNCHIAYMYMYYTIQTTREGLHSNNKTTVEPPNKGHFETSHFVLSLEVENVLAL